jgi:prephenate dehydrogenase
VEAIFCKVFALKQLRQITVIGLGLLGSSITLAILRTLKGIKSVGYSHRAVTRGKARRLGVAHKVVDDIHKSVEQADIVILATPIRTFENIFRQIAGSLPSGCIVTDVGSTKQEAHRWAQRILPKSVYYVGSHPIAGSEQRGLEFARADLFHEAICVLTRTKGTKPQALQTLSKLWVRLGCKVKVMQPGRHDRILANVSHLPHVTVAALINANVPEELKFAGRGFIDTSRIASGPANVWTDVLLTNSANITKGIDKIVRELTKLKEAMSKRDEKRLCMLLKQAKKRRAALLKYKKENEGMR